MAFQRGPSFVWYRGVSVAATVEGTDSSGGRSRDALARDALADTTALGEPQRDMSERYVSQPVIVLRADLSH